jgi:hypothetical protein
VAIVGMIPSTTPVIQLEGEIEKRVDGDPRDAAVPAHHEPSRPPLWALVCGAMMTHAIGRARGRSLQDVFARHVPLCTMWVFENRIWGCFLFRLLLVCSLSKKSL